MSTEDTEVKLMWTKLKKALKIKYPITFWMLASALLFGTLVVVHAAYSGTADVKRVVSTQASSSTVFSSNYMESGGLAIKSLRTTAEGDFICNVTVCNYDQLDPASPARAQITALKPNCAGMIHLQKAMW